MKKSLITTLVAAPLLTLSSLSFAAEPVLLSAVEMDTVTAGFPGGYKEDGDKYASIGQINVSPVTVTQANVFTIGSSNDAEVVSGNFAAIFQ